MSLKLCATVGCPWRIRTGLVRSWFEQAKGKADGRFCWRCRRKQAKKQSKLTPKETP